MIIKFDELRCRNPKCDNYLKKYKGNIIIKEYKKKNQYALFMCKTCGKCFSETQGTPFFGLKNSIDEVAKILTLIPKLGSIRAVARYTHHKPDTIIKWIDLLMDNKNEINNYLMQYYHYSYIQVMELWNSIENRRRKKKN